MPHQITLFGKSKDAERLGLKIPNSDNLPLPSSSASHKIVIGITCKVFSLKCLHLPRKCSTYIYQSMTYETANRTVR